MGGFNINCMFSLQISFGVGEWERLSGIPVMSFFLGLLLATFFFFSFLLLTSDILLIILLDISFQYKLYLQLESC